MKVGIVGLQQVGKTTLFKAITKGQAPIDEFGGKANIGVVPVPDKRFDWLVETNSPKKITPATIEFIDGAAKIGGESRGKFGSNFFADIQLVDALLHVVRVFPSITGDAPTPVKDVRDLTEELILADMQGVETRIQRIEKSLHGTKAGATTPLTMERDLLVEIRDKFMSGELASTLQLSADQEKTVKGYAFLSEKPQIIVANVPEDQIGQDTDDVKELRAYCEESGWPLVVLCATVEAEISELPDAEMHEYLSAMGLDEPARDRLIRETYASLGLISFYTAGEPEVKSYSITKGISVVEAVVKIHSDIARGFIRAEVAHFDDMKEAGGWDEAKRAEKVGLYMKDYIVQDGDVMYIRFKI